MPNQIYLPSHFVFLARSSNQFDIPAGRNGNKKLEPLIILLHKIAMMNAMTNNHEADGASGVGGVVCGGLELKHFRRHVFE